EAAAAARGQIGRDLGQSAARIDASAERADDADDFVVAPSGIQSGLDHDVWRFVRGISCGVDEVVEPAAGTRDVEEEVVGRAAAAEGCLRSFHGEANGELIPVLNNTEAVRALPRPADDVLWVDHERELFLAVRDAFLA